MTADKCRAAIFGYHVLSWIRQQTNWRDALDPEIAAQYLEEFLHLIGYSSGNRELFNPGALRAPGRGVARPASTLTPGDRQKMMGAEDDDHAA